MGLTKEIEQTNPVGIHVKGDVKCIIAKYIKV